MSKKRQRGRPEPEALSPSEMDALNRAFYASQPYDYFERRLQFLLGLAANTDESLRGEEIVHEFGLVTLKVPSSSEVPADERAHKAYVLIEAEMLIHHLAETLLRMFLAHRSKPRVPWISVSELKAPAKLKEEVERLILFAESDDLDRHVGYVFMGASSPNPETDPSVQAKFNRSIEVIRGYLIHFGRVFLDRAPSYNAAKHGCAAQAGEPSAAFPGMPGLSASGPAISTLELGEKEGGHRWIVRTRWISLEQELSMAFVASRLLGSLWDFARIRYVGWPQPEDGVKHFVPGASVEEVKEMGHDEANPRQMIRDVALPPEMHSPPGSGADLLISELTS